jgi:quinol monooxygenase YgiN
MYARAISFITAPNKRKELCSLIENTITPIVRKHQGFVDHVTLISDEEPRLVMVISFWRSKAHADAFRQTGFIDVVDALEPLLEEQPQVRTFDCFSAKASRAAA